jgi:hypothetical protein
MVIETVNLIMIFDFCAQGMTPGRSISAIGFIPELLNLYGVILV